MRLTTSNVTALSLAQMDVATGKQTPLAAKLTGGEDPEAVELTEVTPQAVRRLVPEAEELDVEVHPLPNLGGVNVVIHGLLGDGVAASSRFDPQAKALGEWVRSRHVDVPEELLRDGDERGTSERPSERSHL